MASYHLTASIGGPGASADHAAYIGREGKHKNRPDDDDLEAVGHGNLPAWAGDSPRAFWLAADDLERANGSTYREFVVALPRELTPSQRTALVEDFVQQELQGKHAYHWGIHNPKAALEGGEQPHAHIMYSERILDGIERPREQFFKRYNAKVPERGGCKKASGGKTKDENVAALVATRERWAVIQNEHLARHAHDARVDHRSLKDQGIHREPERHLGQAHIQTQSPAVERVLVARADRTLAATLKAAVDAAQRRWTRVQAVARAVVAKAARKSVLEPSMKASRLPATAPAAPAALTRDRLDELADLLALFDSARFAVIQKARLVEQSRQELMDKKWHQLAEIKQQLEEMQPPGMFSRKATRDSFEDQLKKLHQERTAILDERRTAEKEMIEARNTQSAPEGDAILAVKRQHPQMVARLGLQLDDPRIERQARQHLVERKETAWAVQKALREFQSHAIRRDCKSYGYRDGESEWEAFPEPLRKRIEDFNQLPRDQQEVALGRMQRDMEGEPAQVKVLEQKLAKGKVRYRGLSR